MISWYPVIAVLKHSSATVVPVGTESLAPKDRSVGQG